MPWQKKIFKICFAGQEVDIGFFSSLDKFKEKLEKHILSEKEATGWKIVFPEILQKYSTPGQISEEITISIYEETSENIEKAIQFIWKFPLRIFQERKEDGSPWMIRITGIAPEGYLLVCDKKNVISLYFMGVSQKSGNFQRFYEALTHAYKRAMRPRFKNEKNQEVEQQNPNFYTDETWKSPFIKNDFQKFYREYSNLSGEGELTKKLDQLLLNYRGNSNA